jgi:hypothetical protein
MGGRRGSSTDLVVNAPLMRITGMLCSLKTQELPADHEQIGQRTADDEAMRVLLEPAVAHLGKAEHPTA